MRILIIVSALVVVSSMFARNGNAQDYPDRPIRLVVPFAPGGSTDVVARLLSEPLTARLGKAIVVDNKPGGGANIGTTYVARSKGDGYTLLLASPTQTINSALYRKPPFDIKKDFVPISMVGSSPSLLLVNPSFPAKNLSELIALAKSSPGKITYASAGVASTAHLAAELFMRAAGIELNHIPYKGAAPAQNSVVAGQVDLMFGFIAGSGPLIKAGRLLPLAVAGPHRLPGLPNVPTLTELGVKGVDVDSWYGLLAPAGTPEDVVARLNREVTASMPALSSRLADLGILTAPPAQPFFAEWIDREAQMWARVIKESKTEMID